MRVMIVAARRAPKMAVRGTRLSSIGGAALAASAGALVAMQRQAACQAVTVVPPQPPPMLPPVLVAAPRSLAARAARALALARRWAALAVRCALRLQRHAFILGPAIGSAPVALALARWRGGVDPDTGRSDGAHWWWELLTRRAERSGPALLKFFQWAATRRDLFPAPFCNAAARLQDRTRVPHRAGWAAARRTLDTRLARLPDDGDACWRWISADGGEYLLEMAPTGGEGGDDGPQLLGSGCVAQVFRGRLVRVRTAAMVASARAHAANDADAAGGFAAVKDGDHFPGAKAVGDVAVKILMPGVLEEVHRSGQPVGSTPPSSVSRPRLIM